MVKIPDDWDDNISHNGWPLQKMFDCIPFNKLRKAAGNDDVTGDHPGDDDQKLTAKLKEFASLLVVADPSRTEQQHLYRLIHTAHGQQLAEHMNNLSKQGDPMPQVDVFKLANIASVVEIAKAIQKGDSGVSEAEFSAMLMGHAKLNKRESESVGAAFERILTDPSNTELRKAYQVTKTPNMMSIEPVSVEVGSSSTKSDAEKAYTQLQAKVAEQRKLAPLLSTTKLYEMVFSDNPELVKASVWHSAATSD